ncbi:hypothetical protein A3Q56_02293 [Intoshia linei]|uniref:Uncharacterized protein n=1 Tax=Intoshia linei TaxID=1819745 RepID=A0A177B754_9BILA|nr:hypothetical protein A3Q56_02293 [Intoshia linei]
MKYRTRKRKELGVLKTKNVPTISTDEVVEEKSPKLHKHTTIYFDRMALHLIRDIENMRNFKLKNSRKLKSFENVLPDIDQHRNRQINRKVQLKQITTKYTQEWVNRDELDHSKYGSTIPPIHHKFQSHGKNRIRKMLSLKLRVENFCNQ